MYINSTNIDEGYREFRDLLPWVLPQVPTCSNMMGVQALERAARELCQKSRLWRVTQHPLPLTNSYCEYEFEPYDMADRVQIEWATYEGKPLIPITERQLFMYDAEWLLRTGFPTHYLEMNPGLIRLWPTPTTFLDKSEPYMVPASVGEDGEPMPDEIDQPCSVMFRISMKPALGATSMDRQILDDYYDSIVNGALAYLMFMPAKPWSNPDLAQIYANTFHEGISQATRQAVDGNLQPERVMQYGGL